MKQLTFRLLLFLSAVMLLSACSNDDDETYEWPESQHTLLIYMVGDNDLSTYCRDNTKACIKGMLETETPVNLVIYEDSRSSGVGGTPVLFRLKRNAVNKEKVDTIMIREYDVDLNSADPEVFQEVVNEAFTAYPAPVKGIELWSHGLGWAPGDDYKPTSAQNAATRATQYIGIDKNNYMEIWQLRKALERCPHLDYIMFDACNMGQVEVAYELRNVADYMFACPTEIMAAGLPYARLVKSLSTCQTKAKLSDALKLVIDDFAWYYPGKTKDSREWIIDGGNVALIDLNQITAVHHAYKNLLADCDDRVKMINDNPERLEENFQRFGRSSFYYYFYDMITVAEFLDNNQNHSSFTELKNALGRAVIKEYHSTYFLNFFTEMRSCGLGVAVPEVFQCTYNARTLHAAYNELQWSKD